MFIQFVLKEGCYNLSNKEGRVQRIQLKFKPFKEGDLVWLEAKNINLGVLHWKLKLKQEGLFPITKVISPWAYKLQLLE